MEFRILGSLEVHAGGRRLVLGPREQKVLAALLLDAGRLVTLPRLVDVVWDDDPPESAAKQARNSVSKLRQLLADDGSGPVIATDGAGYRLALGGASLDAQVFETQIAQAAAAAAAGHTGEATRLLQSALGLWRGPALAGLTGQAIEAAAAALEQQRLAVTETYCDHLLSLGCDRDAAAELGPLVASHPLREKAAAQLMLALHRDGQRAEALALYQDTRRVLADELGLDPCPELQQLHQQILTGDPALTPSRPASERSITHPAGDPPVTPPHPAGRGTRAADSPTPTVVPRQLPPAVPHFTGRSSELKALTALLDPDADTPSTVVVSVLAGTAGVGKTALAVHWAHQAAHLFPDGQLYANLHGFGPSVTPLTPAQAIRGFLDALSVSPERTPADLTAQAGLYRSLLAGKRMLVLLDNAHDADQVRPLLPGAPGCLVLITSRSQLTGLVATEGAHLHCLDVLPEHDACQLLATRLGHDRASAEPTAITELTRLCANLPLALAVTAARAAARPHIPIAALAAELGDANDRLNTLDTGDSTASVPAVLGWSHRQLTPQAAAMFRLLGIHPGPDISLPAAASLAGISREAARVALGELTRASLLTEPVPGRFAFHDLLRAYATERAQADDSPEARDAAIDRMLDHYLHTAHTATLVSSHYRRPLTLARPARGTIPEDITSASQAMAWFDADYHVLLAVIALAADSGHHVHAWQLPWAMGDYFRYLGQWRDWVVTHHSALAAAQQLGDPLALARSHDGLATAYIQLGQLEEAQAHLTQALDFCRIAGDRHGEALAHALFAELLALQKRWHEELSEASMALELYRAIGSKAGEAFGLNQVGWAHGQLGDYHEALELCQQALELHREVGSRSGAGITLHTMGYAYHHLGQHAEATDCYRRALAILHESGYRYQQAYTLADLGETLVAAAKPDEAHEAWREALAILDDLGHPDAVQVRARMHECGHAEDR
ncbi:MAG TPA: BTAD domain-containing putative transcriptional regulator [Streptosporangiaceae bacterium]|nr:BTAD domain-containing putative transcriptional regulator [Streptosporangiaceae bacterium]